VYSTEKVDANGFFVDTAENVDKFLTENSNVER
jgi:hypothetical protein